MLISSWGDLDFSHSLLCLAWGDLDLSFSLLCLACGDLEFSLSLLCLAWGDLDLSFSLLCLACGDLDLSFSLLCLAWGDLDFSFSLFCLAWGDLDFSFSLLCLAWGELELSVFLSNICEEPDLSLCPSCFLNGDLDLSLLLSCLSDGDRDSLFPLVSLHSLDLSFLIFLDTLLWTPIESCLPLPEAWGCSPSLSLLSGLLEPDLDKGFLETGSGSDSDDEDESCRWRCPWEPDDALTELEGRLCWPDLEELKPQKFNILYWRALNNFKKKKMTVSRLLDSI